MIRFALPHSANVRIDVVDVQGRLVRRLVDGTVEAGFQQVDWNRLDQNGQRVGPGVYFCRMNAGDYSSRRKMVLNP